MATSGKSNPRPPGIGVVSVHAKNSPEFYAQVLRAIGAPVTAANLRVLDAWQRAEGSSSSWNPFNSEQSSHASGETNYNSAGVKNYPNEDAGVRATVATLKNGYYGPMITALKNDNQEAFIAALVASPWDGGYGGRGAGKTYKNSSIYRLFIQGGGTTLSTNGANPAPTTVTAHTPAGPQTTIQYSNNPGYLPGINPGQNGPHVSVPNPLAGLGNVNKFFQILSNGQFWVRVLEMALGGLLVAYGVFVLTTGTSGVSQAAKAAKLAII